MKSLHEHLAEIEKRAKAATPGEYELRCREFSNHAPVEIWTELGWADQLPRSYREPTFELFAHSRTDIPKLLAVIRKLIEQRDWAIDTLERYPEQIKEQDNAELSEIMEGKK